MGMAAILVMLQSSCKQIFIFLYLKAYIKIGLKWPKGIYEKSRVSVYFSDVIDLGPRSKMTMTFNTHLPSLTQLVVCMSHLSGLRLLYFLKNPLFSLFPIEKPRYPNLTLA